MKQINKFILVVLVLAVFFMILSGTKIFQPLEEIKKEYDYLSLISEVVSLIKTDYVEEVQPEEKFPAAFNGMLRTLDAQSAYLDKDRSKVYKKYLEGKIYHSGIWGKDIFNYFVITDVIPHSPAHMQGLKPGDTIKAINGSNIFGKPYWTMYLSLMTNKPDHLELVIIKDNNGDNQSQAKPEKIVLPTVKIKKDMVLEKRNSDLFLIKIPFFDEKNVLALENFLKNQSNRQKPLKLIIDLRYYLGGDLHSLIQLCHLLLDQSVSLTIKVKNQERKIKLGSTNAYQYRAVVVINSSTHMYGEMLALLLKKYLPQKITLMGNKTSGSMLKLEQFDLDDGSSILLTAGIFQLDGKDLDLEKVSPDIKIKSEDNSKLIDLAAEVLNRNNE